ncbi:MAG TPA: ATP-dependent sacrificial sulfur transferase LarE [Beutenbergiaceae bacterium]|nr:ATP-dependent sacrificial sulfur transferase LarE [Beutenbergiaceae bacterium]
MTEISPAAPATGPVLLGSPSMPPPGAQDTAEAIRAAQALLAGSAPLGVAFSGGVDSSVVLALAVRELGTENVLAIMGISPSLAAGERAAAHRVAEVIGARVLEVTTREGENPDYRRNDVDRCYFCKDELFSVIDGQVVSEHALAAVAYGENADDAARPDRPGSRAASEHQVLRPLAQAGIDKVMVRAIAREFALPCADKPAAPCLASRIPHHQEVTAGKLSQVEQVEAGLRELGFTDSRVRHHEQIARLELLPAELARAATEPLRSAIHTLVTGAGFRYAALDLAGIQSGAFTMAHLQEDRG